MLRRCLLLSMTLHLLMLSGGEWLVSPGESTVGQVAPKVIATLKSAPLAAIPQENGREARQDKSVLAARPVKPHLITAPGKSILPGSASPDNLPHASPETGTVETARLLPEVMPGTPSGHQANVLEETEALSADGLRQYRLVLAREARRFKRYPAYARERGWEGDVIIMLTGTSVLEVPSVSLDKSSGHAALDEQALEIMRRAVSQAALPESLRGRRFRIAVPIQFRLDD